jgi:hypothetical protein
MIREIDGFVAWLRSIERRMDVSDDDLLEIAWQVHPRFHFFKSLPWRANPLDLGAGDGGLANWKGWLRPQRPDLNLYGVDLSVGAHKDLYAGWEAVNLDAEPPSFPGVPLNGAIAGHLIEYLAMPEALIEWLAGRSEIGSRMYFEWSSPVTLDLPTREQLLKFDIDVVTSNFLDDSGHKDAPDLATLDTWLTEFGLTVISNGAIDLGILGEEMFARGADRYTRSMGYWSMTRSALYAIAVKSKATPLRPATNTGVSRISADRGRRSARQTIVTTDPQSLRTKRALLVSGLFDAGFYRATYRDMRASPVDPLTHYIAHGEAEGRSPNPVFFPRYYRRQWMAGASATQNALAHYAEEGERQGHKPHPAFDPQAYLAANPPLAEFVDRPLFHYLKIGRAAGLPVAPRARGEAFGRILEAQPHAGDFEYSQRRNHYELMRYKQALVQELGVEDGFTFYQEMFALPDSGRIDRKAVTSLYEFAKEHGAAFHMLDPGGEPFVMPPPRVIGEGNHRALEGLSRAIFVTCLIDAQVRARSSFIAVGDKALLDYQGDELARIDDELDFDPAVFHAKDGAAWMIGPEDEASPIEIDEAFMLLGPHSDGFGHWMLDLLPRYIASSASGALPPVPVLIDQTMPATQRESLRLMLPEGGEIIDLPPHATARVRRLWCVPSLMQLVRRGAA